MDGHALEVLEFPAVVRRVEGATETPLGLELAHNLAPSADASEVARAQRLTTEAVALLDGGTEPTLSGIADVREEARLAARDGTLAPGALRAVARSTAVALEARRVLLEADDDIPLLSALAEPLATELSAVADAIGGAVEEDGSDLRDTASPQLRRLRTRVREARARIADDIARLARSSELRDHLQEQFVTERAGRPVLAVKVSARGSVPGIVHDASGSGQTLFVEPFAIVELNNRLAEALSAEREEVERILRGLSALVGSHAGQVVDLVEATAAIDLALARGTVSRRWRGAQVTVADEVRLLGARHPLLDERSVVPVDLDLGLLRALVVSGPNTGGKTVALKTLGLAALLHQSGLRPPAEAAMLPVFDRVLADIGDEQSIEMSLSTFSAHLRTMVSILSAATDRSLVLLDEVAGGTDPVEGSALAQALVAQLARQARLTVVSTHYAELKEWASSEPAVANAATALDLATNEPLYSLSLGRPGTSHALGTAERLGLDPAVVADARARIEPERRRTAALLAEAEDAARTAARAQDEAEAERREAELLQRRLGERETELAREIAAVRASADRERARAIEAAKRELAEASREIEAMRAELRRARRDEGERRHAAEEAERAAERKRDRRLGAATERSTRADSMLRALDQPIARTAPLGPGDPVEAPDVGVRGTLASIDGEEAEVVGPSGFRVRIPLARLRATVRREPVELEQPAVRVVASARGDVSDELDVRGLRAQEARESVRAFVDDAALAGLAEVRVVHGRGTGAVRAAVREELTGHHLVERHESDSRDGATLAHLG